MIFVNTAESILASGSDPDELADILSTSRMKMSATPLTRRGFSFDCKFGKADGIFIGQCRYEGDFSLKRDGISDKFHIFLPRSGNATFNAARREIATSARQGVIVDGTRNMGALISGPREHVVVSIDSKMLYRGLSAILGNPVSDSLDFRPEIDLATGSGLALERLAALILNGLIFNDAPLRRSPLALACLSDALVRMILETLPHRFSNELSGSGVAVPKHVKRAMEFMKANLSNPITFHDITIASGMSSRALQYGFRQFKMTTPMAYLQNLRLDALHLELKQAQPGQTVAGVALKWGFIHLSRMAFDYRHRFGQLPSETLRHALPLRSDE